MGDGGFRGLVIHNKSNYARVEGNRLTDNLHGVRVQGAKDSLVARNTITGRVGRQAELGNGVTVWNAPGHQWFPWGDHKSDGTLAIAWDEDTSAAPASLRLPRCWTSSGRAARSSCLATRTTAR